VRGPVPLDGGPWRLQMGLHRLDVADWLEDDDRRAEELAQKSALLAEHRDEVLVASPAGDDGAAELCELVLAWLEAHRPWLVERTPDGVVERSTATHLDPAMPPLELAARLVQEDLCVLVEDAGTWRLRAACVCFPSRWSLREKLGASLLGIHEPVPGYGAALGAPSERFFDRLDPARPAWRCNWTLLDTPERFLPSPASRRSVGVPHGTEALWFRVERQTLRRLPRTGAIAFTIRTYVTSLDELLAARPSTAAALAATLATVPADVAAYKGWTAMLPALLDALGAR